MPPPVLQPRRSPPPHRTNTTQPPLLQGYIRWHPLIYRLFVGYSFIATLLQSICCSLFALLVPIMQHRRIAPPQSAFQPHTKAPQHGHVSCTLYITPIRDIIKMMRGSGTNCSNTTRTSNDHSRFSACPDDSRPTECLE